MDLVLKYMEGMFGYGELDFEIGMRMSDIHFSHLVGRRLITIPIPGGNRNALIIQNLIFTLSNSNHILIPIPILSPVTNLRRLQSPISLSLQLAANDATPFSTVTSPDVE